jgi:hypothetical protein
MPVTTTKSFDDIDTSSMPAIVTASFASSYLLAMAGGEQATVIWL